MSTESNVKWVRSPSFRKYFATSFGISKSGDIIRLDFGDERVQFSEKDFANVSECQISMNKESFKAFCDLIDKVRKKE